MCNHISNYEDKMQNFVFSLITPTFGNDVLIQYLNKTGPYREIIYY